MRLRLASGLPVFGLLSVLMGVGPQASAVSSSSTGPVFAQISGSCAVTTSGGAKCWGFNNTGALGDGTTINRTSPVDVSGLTSGVAQISVGWGHTCAVTTSGGAMCWGFNRNGQLGDGTTTNSSMPVQVVGLTSGVAQISASRRDTCVVMTSGGAKCWGHNNFGALGDGTKIDSSVPVDVLGLASGVAQISTSRSHTCAVTTAGGALCWGHNEWGYLGNGTTTSSSKPVGVSGLSSGVAQISASGTSTCALTASGGVRCWGNNYYGLGVASTDTIVTTPSDVVGLSSPIAEISSGGGLCGLTTFGGVKCWGGSGPPIDLGGLTSGVAQISYPSCVLMISGAAMCLGNNYYGELGDGTKISSTTPVNVIGSAGPSQPDTSIKRSTDTLSLDRGIGIYNATTKNQGVTTKVAAGSFATFNVVVRNAGSATDSITVGGCSSSSGFVVTYRSSKADITADIVAGTQSTGTLASADAYSLNVRIQATSATVSGSKDICKITAASANDVAKTDVVRATLVVQ
ncbi:MAG: hypothetical protein QOI81_2335 [Actinomycetota bacterium]|nr:hypothetical protein [Actinomycetota bacterium]